MNRNAHPPRLFVLAGTNGAGKSSIGGATVRARGGHYFNPDEAAAAIRRAQPHFSTTQANSAAWHEGRRLLQQAIRDRLDFNFETTLGGRSFVRLLQDAAEQGFEVRIWYVGLQSPEQHLARVRARVAHGGHDIPEADIRRRFDQSRLNLIQLLPCLTELRVYDNSDEADPRQGRAPRPRLILHWRQAAGGEPGRGLLVPDGGQSLATTPAWAKPVVMAALKESAQLAASAPRPTPSAGAGAPATPGHRKVKPPRRSGARPAQSRPAR